MELLTSILLAVVYLALAAFLIYLSFFLRGLLIFIKEIGKDLSETTKQLRNTFEHLRQTLDEISILSRSIKSDIDKLNSAFDAVKETAEDYKRIKDKIVNTIEEPIDELQSNARAIIKGIRVFFQTLFRRSE